jgi:hypothetical protein
MCCRGARSLLEKDHPGVISGSHPYCRKCARMNSRRINVFPFSAYKSRTQTAPQGLFQSARFWPISKGSARSGQAWSSLSTECASCGTALPSPRAFHVVELAPHRLAPVARVGRRDANRRFQEHPRSLAEMRFQQHFHPRQKAGCRTIEGGRASAREPITTVPRGRS